MKKHYRPGQAGLVAAMLLLAGQAGAEGITLGSGAPLPVIISPTYYQGTIYELREKGGEVFVEVDVSTTPTTPDCADPGADFQLRSGTAADPLTKTILLSALHRGATIRIEPTQTCKGGMQLIDSIMVFTAP